DEHGLIYSVAQDAVDIVQDAQALANECFTAVEHPTRGAAKLVANPIKLSRTPATIRTMAPEFGQHTEEVLLENGYSWDELSQLKEQGVIA
ncbi:MAG: CoA transferase, partial [Dehalococcoidia bacterium]|nr:CoA transferase [Dehalococcoidia bacterium]